MTGFCKITIRQLYCSIIITNSIQCRAATSVRIIMHLILVHCPLGMKCCIGCRHRVGRKIPGLCKSSVLIPTSECVACFSWCCWRCCLRTKCHCLIRYARATLGIKMQCIVINLPLCIQRCISCYRHSCACCVCRATAVNHRIPASECMTYFCQVTGICCHSHCSTRAKRLSC